MCVGVVELFEEGFFFGVEGCDVGGGGAGGFDVAVKAPGLGDPRIDGGGVIAGDAPDFFLGFRT